MRSDSSETNKSESGKNKSKSVSPEAEFAGKLTFRDYLIATEQQANKPLPLWRLALPLAIQTALILAVPSQAMFTSLTGKEVILQTVPANPSNVLQNNSLTLDYSISRVSTLRRLPGWQDLLRRNQGTDGELEPGTNLYVILQEQQSFNSGLPRAWRPVRVSSDRPMSLPDNQAALKGVYTNDGIMYGMESYYVPEEQRRQMTNDIYRAAQRNRGGRLRPIVVKVKVDSQGKAVPVSLWVRDRNYRF